MIIGGQKYNHVLTITDVEEFNSEQRRWLRALARKRGILLPIMGGDGDDEGGAGDDSGSDDNADNSSSSGGDDNDDDDSNDDSSDDDNSDDDDDDDDKDKRAEARIPRSEYERLKRVAREHDAAQKRQAKEAQKSEEKRKKAEGQYEELLTEKDEQIRTTEGERDEARYQLDAFKRRVRVTEAAKRLNFKDPEDAFRFLSDEDTEDETSTERALKRLSKSKQYLVSERRPTGAPVNGDGATLTMEQLKNLSPEEVNKNWPEIQKALANQ